MTKNPLAALALASLAFGSPVSSANAQVLKVHDASLTTYLPPGASGVQDIQPLPAHRGVLIDGTLAAPPTFPWSLAGDAFKQTGWDQEAWLGDLRLHAGTYQITDIDLALPAPGFSWVVGRSYNPRQHDGGGYVVSDGPQGRNWFQMSQPELVFFDNDTDASDEEEDMLVLVYGADRYVEFRRVEDNSDSFRAVNGAAGVVRWLVDSSGPDLIEFTDPFGVRTTFFGLGDADIPDAKEGQLWKIEDPAGNVAYVGHETDASQALSAGYDNSGRIVKAYDTAAGIGRRRFTYTYASGRLSEVKAETKSGGTWDSPTGVLVAGKVEYFYHDGQDAHGSAGDLKRVTITTPVADGTLDQERNTYYRYYKGAYDAGTNPGHAGQLKLVMGFEGTRAFDWNETGAGEPEFDQGYETAAFDDEFKKHVEAYFEYEDNAGGRRLNKVWFNGECGCGSSTDGVHEFAYEASSYYNTNKTAGYDPFWAERTVARLPEDVGGNVAYFTTYFDETGQPLTRVITNGDPAGDPAPPASETWVTHAVRDSAGRLATLHSPENIASYSHGSTGESPVTTSTSDGHVLAFVRVSTGDAEGLVAHFKYRQGDPGSPTNYLDQSLEYDVRTEPVGDATLMRPLVTAVWDYTEQTTTEAQTGGGGNPSGAFVTQFAHAFFSATPGDPGYMALKTEVTTHPAVSTSRNGSNTSNTSVTYYRKDGTVAFEEDEDGSFTYSSLNAVGLNDRVIEDARTNSADFDAGDDPNTVWGVSESGVGLHEVTDYTYDSQGRLATTVRDPGGAHERRFRSYVTRLADHRTVRLEVPRYTTTGTSTIYYGPVRYLVSNQAGHAVADAVIGLNSTGTTTAIGLWIDDTAGDDPLQSLGGSFSGTIERLRTSAYDEAGRKLLAERLYHSIPTSLEGAQGTNYEQVEYGYDNRGRRDRVVEVKGTIYRTTFDIRGGWPTGVWMGTSDTGWTGFAPSDMTQQRVIKPGKNAGFPKRGGVPPLYWSSAGGGAGGSGGGGGPGGGASGDGFTDSTQCWMLVVESTGETTFTRDFRGNVIVRESPLAPHLLVKYDNLNRIIAIGFYDAAPTADKDPTSYATGRLGLVRYAHDEAGRTWKITRHNIDPADGSDDDSLDVRFWRDATGRVAKTDGPELVKRLYDALGRVTHEFVLARDNDSTYADAVDPSLSGDVVLEERQWLYQAGTGNLKAQATISRHYDDLATTGRLDTNADSDPWTYTASNLKGRIDVTAHWYDALDRPQDTVALGTYALGEPSGPTDLDLDGLSVPARSDTALRTTYAYDKAGAVLDVTDPRGLVTRTEHDDAGRVTTTIRNRTGATPPLTNTTRDNDLYTRFVYGNSAQSPWVDELWVDVDGDGTQDAEDQVTRYTYGVSASTTPSSLVNARHLLLKVEYPDSAGAKDTVRYGYERNGRIAAIYDQDGGTAQDGNVIAITYDTLGRETMRSVSAYASGTGLDQLVDQIVTAYDDLGRVSTVEQLDNFSLIDQVKVTYDGWGNIAKIEQDHDSAVGGGGTLPTYAVSFDYAKATGGRDTIRRTKVTLPGNYAIDYAYSSSGGLYDDDASRVSQVKRGNVVVAMYDYLGVDRVTGVEHPEPGVFRRLYGSTSGLYPGLDRFNRVVHDRWTKDLSTDVDFYNVELAYDRNGNPTLADDHVHKTRFDARWTIDDADRVTRTEQGDWNGSGFASLSQDERWDYTVVGGWDLHKLDIDGDGSFTNYGAGDLQDRGTLNTANELTGRDLDDDSSVDLTLAYDDMGNLVDDGEHYEHVYDAFGRLRKVKNRSNGDLVAEYRYNGLGYLIAVHEDTDGDGDVDSSDAWRRFVYDHRWRVVAEHQNAETTPRLFSVHHAAGLDGRGTGSYLDQLVCRERKVVFTGSLGNAQPTAENPNPTAPANERLYYCQNRRADVVALVTSSGRQVEQARYSAYGVPFGLPAGDADSDGDVDSADLTQIQSWIDNSIYDARGDLDLDGDVDAADKSIASALSGTTLGRGVLTRSTIGNRSGYGGYLYHGTVLKYHVRNRVYDPYTGRWLTRDPAEYMPGSLNLYEYALSAPESLIDPTGLFAGPLKKKKKGPPPPAAPPGPPLNPGILKDGGIITFENPRGVDHSAFYVKDSTCPSGYRVGTQQPGGFYDEDLADYLRRRPPTDTIYIDPVRGIRPDRGRDAIQDMKKKNPDYDASAKCTDVCIILLDESGGPTVDGGGTQIPMRLRDKIREIEDQPPGQVYPPGSRPPPNPAPAPPPQQQPGGSSPRRRGQRGRPALVSRKRSHSSSTSLGVVLCAMTLATFMVVIPHRLQAAPLVSDVPTTASMWYDMLEAAVVSDSFARKPRALAVSMASRNEQCRQVAIARLMSDDAEVFRFASDVIASLPSEDSVRTLMDVAENANRPAKIRSFALLAVETTIAAGLFGTPDPEWEEPGVGVRVLREWLSRHDPPWGVDRVRRASEIIQAAAGEMHKRMESGEPDPNAYEQEWKLIQFYCPFLVQPGRASAESARALVRHLEQLQDLPRVNDAVDRMVAGLMLSALYKLCEPIGMIEPIDDAMIRRRSRVDLHAAVTRAIGIWNNDYATIEDPIQWRMLSLARAGLRTRHNDEPSDVLLSLMEAIRVADVVTAVTAANVLKELGVIRAGTWLPSMSLAFNPEGSSFGEQIVLDAWRGRVLTEASEHVTKIGTMPRWNPEASRWELRNPPR